MDGSRPFAIVRFQISVDFGISAPLNGPNVTHGLMPRNLRIGFKPVLPVRSIFVVMAFDSSRPSLRRGARMMNKQVLAVLLLSLGLLACGSNNSDAQGGPTPTPGPTATPGVTPTPPPGATPTPSPGATATPTPSATPTPLPSAAPTPTPTPGAAQTAVFLVTEAPELIGILANAPGQILLRHAITNLTTDNPANPPFALSMDIHPTTGDIYLLMSDLRLYTVNANTGVVSLRGRALASLGLTDPDIRAMAFDSATNELRLLDGTNARSYRISATDGSIIAEDMALSFATGDPNDGSTVFPIGLDYDGPVTGGARTAFVLDDFNDVLAQLGLESDTGNSARDGTLTTIGPWDLTTASTGLSVERDGAFGYTISLSPANTDKTILRRINLATGTSTNSGEIGSESGRFVALALAVVPGAGSTGPTPTPPPGSTPAPSPTPSVGGGNGPITQQCIDQGTGAGLPAEQVVLFCETVFGTLEGVIPSR